MDFFSGRIWRLTSLVSKEQTHFLKRHAAQAGPFPLPETADLALSQQRPGCLIFTAVLLMCPALCPGWAPSWKQSHSVLLMFLSHPVLCRMWGSLVPKSWMFPPQPINWCERLRLSAWHCYSILLINIMLQYCYCCNSCAIWIKIIVVYLDLLILSLIIVIQFFIWFYFSSCVSTDFCEWCWFCFYHLFTHSYNE